MRLVARVGMIGGLWRPSVALFLLNVPHMGLNVTLEEKDITLLRVSS
jgi:hypothetical protein